jgi:hypothetical protein
MLSVLDRHAKPDVSGYGLVDIASVDISAHERTALRQDLIRVMFGPFHRGEHCVDEPQRDLLMEKVAH